MGDAGVLDAHGKRAWQRAQRVMRKALACYERHGRLPRSAWLSFDRKDNARELRQLLDEAIAVLQHTKLEGHRQDLAQLEAQARKLREDVARQRAEGVAAQPPRGWFAVARVTPQGRVLKAKQQIALLDKRRSGLVDVMVRELRTMGTQLSADQMQAMLLSVSGDDIAQLLSLFHNIRQFTVQLQALMEADPEDLIAARRYYGMYLVLLQVLVHAHERFIERLERQYLPDLQRLEDENLQQRSETQRLLRGASDAGELEALEANQRAQDVTDGVIGLYRSFLEHQRAKAGEALDGLDRRLEVASNTYRTAQVASSLVTLIRSSAQDLNALQGMQLPELVPFQNEEMARRFQAVTARMRRLPRT